MVQDFDESLLLSTILNPIISVWNDSPHQVMRWSDATYLEDQDMWRLSGIHRDVSLLCKPAKARIADFKVTTPLWFGGGPEASAYQVLNTCRRMTAGGAITIGGEGTELLSARLDVEVRVVRDPNHPPYTASCPHDLVALSASTSDVMSLTNS